MTHLAPRPPLGFDRNLRRVASEALHLGPIAKNLSRSAFTWPIAAVAPALLGGVLGRWAGIGGALA